VGLEPTIPVFEWLKKVGVIVSTVTVIGLFTHFSYIFEFEDGLATVFNRFVSKFFKRNLRLQLINRKARNSSYALLIG
jgi:hypothetical protein